MTRPILLAIAILCGIIAGTILLCTDVFGAGQTVEQLETELQTHPPQALQPYHYTAPGWTGWNRFWFAAAIGGQAADAATTIDGLDGGRCREVNPLFGDDPDEAAIIGSKIVLGLLGIWIAEHVYSGRPDQHVARNWVYGAMAVTGIAAAGWNAGQDCE